MVAQPTLVATSGASPAPASIGGRNKEEHMAENSFDVVAEVDRQEVDNAINQASKEVAQRYDFKGTDAKVAWSGEQVLVTANSEERVNAALDVLRDKLVKRKVSLKSLEYGEPKPGGQGQYRLEISLVEGIPTDKAKAMVKQIKASKLKVTPAIQGDQLRISSKSRDALQEVQELLRANDQDLPLRFTNYK
jgi:cyclic-di-GMP-binding protein